MNMTLGGKVALVTGGGSGIGRASALVFAREGAKVVVADVVVEGGEETVTMIRQAGGEAVFVQADVSKATQVETLIRKAVETYDTVHCAHNNAGIAGIMGPTDKCTEENWDMIINTNLKSIWLCMKHEIPEMLKHGAGVIVNTASTAGLVGSPYAPAYAASSHGIVGLTKTAALEYAKTGIRINSVCPGVIRTPMIESHIRSNPEVEARLIAACPVGRMGTPDEVAEVVVWLCSESASFVTGHAMVVDGGRVAQ